MPSLTQPLVCALMCVLTALFCAPAFALDPNQPLGQLFHTSWNAKNGLNGSVVTLAQTTDGYLWIGTTDGLFRFDGLSFERYRSEHEPLPSSSVSTLMAVPDGGLWVGFDRGGASLLKNGTVTNYTERDGLPVSRVRCFAQDGDGTIWAAVVGGFARLDGGRWHRIRMDWNYPAKSARTLLVDRRGTLWVISGDRVLFLPKGERKFQDVGLQTGPILTFTQTPDGALLFSDNDRAVLRSFRSPMDHESDSLPYIAIPARAILFDRDGALWIAGKGISRLPFPVRLRGQRVSESSPGAERFTEKEGLTSDAVETIIEDREGNIWVGTDGGLDRFRRRNLKWFPFPSGTSYFSLVAGDRGEVWAGSNGDKRQGVMLAEDGTFARGGPQQAYMTYRDPDGAIWISARDSLFRWSRGTFSTITPPEQALRMHRSPTKDPIIVSSITKDRSGSLWVSIGGCGEFQLKDGVWKFVEILKDHPDWAANAAYTDAADRVWLAYGEYVAVVDHGTSRAFSNQDGLTIGPFTVFAGNGQQMWVGGEGGLAFLQGDRFRILNGAGDSGFGSITGMVAPPNDGLWLSAGPGIVHIPEPEVQRALRQYDYKVNSEVFDLVSDLPEQLQRGGVYSSGAIRGSDGLLWFATRSGVARVDPAHIFRNPVPPPVVIRSIIADGKSYPTFANAMLPPLTRSLQIDYTALSFSIPERVRFRYKLEGSEDWQDAGTRRQAFYTNPKPGRYRFRVLACNNDGVWNESGATMDFSIAPAFYQTIWFQALCWASGAGILWVFYLLRLRQATAQMHGRLEERLAERTRIARELHDTLLQSFHGLMFRFQAARNMLTRRPEDALRALDEALEQTEQAIAEGRDAIQDLRSEPFAHHDLEHLVTAMGQQLEGSQDATLNSAHFSVTVEGERRALSPLLEDEVYRITCELLRNAFQHARARQIEAEIRYDDHQLRLRIRDDGKGIDPKVLQEGGRAGHWGLPGLRERAKHIGAQLGFWSEAGAGTEVELTVPAAVAYMKSHDSTGFRLFRKR
jgi:signal transduction histidine kinase/ligand-binding sensor domain-containing protein